MIEPMTRRDREQLAQVAKMRARVAKSSVEQRELVLRSQVEDELQGIFAAEETTARHAEEIARDVAHRANRDLEQKFEEASIPERFRPQIKLVKPESLLDLRAESNAQRRQSLRMLAGERIRALGANARVEVDRQCADTVTALITGGLSGVEAQNFLDRMPTIDQLMLAPSVAELESVHDAERSERRKMLGNF